MFYRYPEQMVFTKLFTPRKFDNNATQATEAVVIRA